MRVAYYIKAVISLEASAIRCSGLKKVKVFTQKLYLYLIKYIIYVEKTISRGLYEYECES